MYLPPGKFCPLEGENKQCVYSNIISASEMLCFHCPSFIHCVPELLFNVTRLQNLKQNHYKTLTIKCGVDSKMFSPKWTA